MEFKLVNNFLDYKTDFFNDTGFDYKHDAEEYLMYVNTRVTSELAQTIKYINDKIDAGDFLGQLTNLLNRIKK